MHEYENSKSLEVQCAYDGDVDLLDVQAPIRTYGTGARGFNLYDGSLREARFAGIKTTGDGSVGIHATGRGSDAAHVTGNIPDLDGIKITAADGQRLIRT